MPVYINQLLREVTPKRRSRRQLAQLDQRKPFITACFRHLPSSYTVGSDFRHSSCENKPLEPGKEYVFFLLAELNATGVSCWFSSVQHSSVDLLLVNCFFLGVDLIIHFCSFNRGSLEVCSSESNTFREFGLLSAH